MVIRWLMLDQYGDIVLAVIALLALLFVIMIIADWAFRRRPK